MRLTTVLCSVALVVQGIEALPHGGRNPDSPKYQRRDRFRRRQHWGPPQGGRQNGHGNGNNLKPVPPPVAITPPTNHNPAPGSAQAQDNLPPLEPGLEGGPVSGLNFLPGDGDDDINTASVPLDAPVTSTTPCITTVTQTIDVTLLITASRPKPSLVVILRWIILLFRRCRRPLVVMRILVLTFMLIPLPRLILCLSHCRNLPLPFPQAAQVTSEPCPEDEDGSPMTLSFEVVPVPASTVTPYIEPASSAPATSMSVDIFNLPLEGVEPSAVVSSTPSSSNSLWAEFWPGEQQRQGTAAGDVAAAETGFVTSDEKKKQKQKRDVDYDDEEGPVPDNKPDRGSLGGGAEHIHDVGREGEMITRTETRTIQHFATITPSANNGEGFVTPPLGHPRPRPLQDIPHVPLPPLPAPPPSPAMTDPPKSPAFRRPKPQPDISSPMQLLFLILELKLKLKGYLIGSKCPNRHIHCNVKDIHPGPPPVRDSPPGFVGGWGVDHRPPGRKDARNLSRRDYGAETAEDQKNQIDTQKMQDEVDGAFLIEQVVEEAPGVPISLGGCYQRCLKITQGNPSGCKSYAYYPPHPHSQDLEARGENHRPQEQEEYSSEEGHEQDGQGKPHCDIFGEEVAAIFSPGAAAPSPPQPVPVHNTWFDLECGSPLDEKWAGLGVGV
ncbi:hypothetical protein QBC37DRAFT_445536 [Rhypophila decipiens]|uniref:Uncharacterized protein n=1 Tax=Rhypophila decipiens TaxID=261697 RepID=A0AAN7BDY3_9PEZI|nr:hypothetical protein QBC37DRAFT_445536 [Rhypophila decipiens]